MGIGAMLVMWPGLFKKELFESVGIGDTWVKGNEWLWPLVLTMAIYSLSNFEAKIVQSFNEMTCISIFQYERTRKQIRPCCKLGHGLANGIIWTIHIWAWRLAHVCAYVIPAGPGGYTWNLVTIGSLILEKKSFEIADGWTEKRQTDGWRLTVELA